MMDTENNKEKENPTILSPSQNNASPVVNEYSSGEVEKQSKEEAENQSNLFSDVIHNNNIQNNCNKMEQLTYMDALVVDAKNKLQKEIKSPSSGPHQSGGPKKKKGWDVFWRRTMADMRNKKLLPIKVLFFFKAATLFVLYPFLTLHIKSLGLTASEAGINSAFIPVVAILGPPIAGVIADKIGNFKTLLASLTLVTAGLALLLLLVPTAREVEKLPGNMTFSIGCLQPENQNQSEKNESSMSMGSFGLEMLGESTCTLNLSSAPWDHLQSSIVQCGLVCPILLPVDVNSKVTPRLNTIPVEENKTYFLPGKKVFFTPFSNQTMELVCSKSENVSCYLAFAEVSDSDSLESLEITSTDIRRLKLNGNAKNLENVTNLSFNIEGSWTFANQEYKTVPSCVTTESIQMNQVKGGSDVEKCVEKCLVNYDRKLFCSNKEETIVYNVAVTFWLYTLFRIILGLGSATSWIMFEGAVLAILKESGGDYGLQRMSALVAAILVTPISGSLIYWFQDFRPAFYLYAVLQCISAFLTLQLDLSFKAPAEKVLGHLKEVLSQVEILIFFFAMFLSGTAWGYLETFLFWFVKNLGGSEILMGLTVSVGGVAGLPVLLLSRIIIKKVGHVNVLSLGLLFYCIRLMGYSFIENPWYTLPFEALEAITSSLAITAAATYAAALSTNETIASIQGIMGALYFGIGRGAGSLFGGFFIKWYGERITFQIFSVASLISAIFYAILNLVYIRKHTRVHHGLDLTNLRGDRFDGEDENESKKGRLALSDTEEVNITNALALSKINGYIGPCDVNSFTDVPLDEEEAIESPTKSASRPSSFLSQKSKLKLEKTRNGPAET